MSETLDANTTPDFKADCGHFIPEERADEVVRHIQALTTKIANG